jgi:Resolvase, N terminal domain
MSNGVKRVGFTVRREFDMLAVWSSDRLGRSLKHFIEVLEPIRDTGTALYIHTQSVDTTTASGRAMFGMLGIFAEFDGEMIQARIKAGMQRARDEIKRSPTGTFVARKSGVSRRSLGRPGPSNDKLDAARTMLATGAGMIKTAKDVGLGVGTVHKFETGDGRCCGARLEDSLIIVRYYSRAQLFLVAGPLVWSGVTLLALVFHRATAGVLYPPSPRSGDPDPIGAVDGWALMLLPVVLGRSGPDQ